METTAVYFESRIRTYGFQLDKALSLLEIRFSVEKPGPWGAGIEELGSMGIKFNLIFGQMMGKNEFYVYIAVKESSVNRFIDRMTNEITINSGNCRLTTSPVEILSFQGPHYKDRYGIALEALESLSSKDIPVIAFCCSVSCIYLVLERGRGDSAHAALMERFEIPPKNSRRKGNAGI